MLKELEWLCQGSRLLMSFIPIAPLFCFRIHNAGDREGAQAYLRFGTHGFMAWGDRGSAHSLYDALPYYLQESRGERIFVPTKQFVLTNELKRKFEGWLDQQLR